MGRLGLLDGYWSQSALTPGHGVCQEEVALAYRPHIITGSWSHPPASLWLGELSEGQHDTLGSYHHPQGWHWLFSRRH